MDGSRCNLRCAYCLAGYADKIGRTGAVIDESKILELIRPHEFPSISIWGGEPFFNFAALKSVVNFCRRHYAELPIIVFSNGTAFTKAKIEFIRENNLNITLSHDAFSQHYRSADFLRDKASLALIREIDNLGFSSVIHRYNCDFVAIFEYFEEICAALDREFYWGFELFQPSGPQSHKFIPGDEELATFSASLDFLLERFSAGHTFAVTALRPGLMSVADILDGNALPHFRCGADKRLTVTTGGLTAFCQMMAESGNFDLPSGDLPEMCRSCSVSPLCRGFCPTMSGEERTMICSLYKVFFTKLRKFLFSLRTSPDGDAHNSQVMADV
jgi:sulfatase maturation enzyme AslB (radical SAM superfamily)